MLAKQSWRIVRNPESLLYKVLKGRYFRDEDFFNAQIGSNSSQTWRSIVWGRELFKAGYRWRVGNGRHIYISQDPWLQRKWAKSPLVVPEMLKWGRVEALILGNGEWNVPLIKDSFIPADAEEILSIPLGGQNRKDEVVWALDSKGVFSVKSAYHLAVQLNSANEASGSHVSGQKGKWRKIWKLNIPPRTRVGVWKIMKNYIPSKQNLIGKGLDINPGCSFCRSKLETLVHML